MKYRVGDAVTLCTNEQYKKLNAKYRSFQFGINDLMKTEFGKSYKIIGVRGYQDEIYGVKIDAKSGQWTWDIRYLNIFGPKLKRKKLLTAK